MKINLLKREDVWIAATKGDGSRNYLNTLIINIKCLMAPQLSTEKRWRVCIRWVLFLKYLLAKNDLQKNWLKTHGPGLFFRGRMWKCGALRGQAIKKFRKFSISPLIKRRSVLRSFWLMSALILSDVRGFRHRKREQRPLPAIVAEVTLTDDCWQAVWKELRSKNKQMDGSSMDAIVLLQPEGFASAEKTMKYCTSLSG